MILLLLGCYVDYDSSCVHEEREVEDDDSLGDLDFTVGELVSEVAGARTFPATGETGSIVAAALTLTRSVAPAVFDDTTVESTSALRPGLFGGTDMVLLICEDQVTVPFSVQVESEGLALAGEVDALSELWSDTPHGVGGVSLLSGVEDGVLAGPADEEGDTFVVYFDGPELIRVDVGSDDTSLLAFPPVAE